MMLDGVVERSGKAFAVISPAIISPQTVRLFFSVVHRDSHTDN
jgi:hypothetical protein